MISKLKITSIFILLLTVSSLCYGQKKSRTTKANVGTGAVLDQEKLLNDENKLELESIMRDFIAENKTPIGIIIMPKPMKADPSKRWTIGKTKNPSGIVVMLSETHKEVSIGFGPKVSVRISENKVDELIEEITFSDFQNGKYFEGLKRLINELSELLE